jgi:hypothetical protein
VMTNRDRAFLKLPELPDKPYPYAHILIDRAWRRRLNYSTLAVIAMLALSFLGWLIGK